MHLAHVSLLSQLLNRELKDRYLGTTWGAAWAILQPVLTLAMYSFVFAFVFKVRLTGQTDPSQYVIFVAIALWPWFLLQESISRSIGALRGNATLIRKTALPRDYPVVVACLSTILIHLAGYAVVLFGLTLLGAQFHWDGVPLLILMLAALSLLALSAGFLFSLVQLVWRDIEIFIQPALNVVFYLTPILYPLQLVPEPLRDVAASNPIAWLIGRIRDALGTGSLPGTLDFVALVLSVCMVLAIRKVYLRICRQVEDLL